MRYFPIHLDIRGRRTIIVGGGRVAARKCAALLAAGAAVEVIAPAIDARLDSLWRAGAISCTLREYRAGDLEGAALVFAATDDETVNTMVAREAKERDIDVNVADAPDAGTFTMPASLRRGELLVTVSTGGRCPALAAEVRRELAETFGSEYEAVTDLLGAVREKLLTEKGGSAYNKELLHALAGRNLASLFKNNALAEIDRLLLELFGTGFSLAELGAREKDPE